MNVKIVTALLILAVATILALVSVLLFVSKTKSCNSGNQKTSALKHNDQSLIFSDLTHAELDQVVAYLKKNINENLVDISKADPSSNCIYSVELLPPSKKDALLYLDKGGPKPRREAMAVVYFGSHSEPEIMEYVVGPLPNPTYKNDVTLQRYKGKLPYHRRPVIGSEYKQIRQHFLLKEYPKAKSFLKEVLGYNESDSEYFAALTSAPRGFASGERQTWFGIFLNTQGSGFFLHPTGLELLFNHKNLDYNKWSVEKVFYNGINNSLVAHDMEFQDQVVPWNPEWKLQQTVLTKKVLASENQAAFQQHGPMPRYMQFASKQKNKWDHERSFRIQMVSFAGDYLPEKSSVHNSMNWAKYKLAVTKHKEEEHTSSSIYNQNDPWSPTVQFSNFINNENIIDEDLVAWITTGFLHIPHAEDIPNTVTAGNGVGFYLRPYNYFNEDPSVFSEDAVYFQPHEDLSSCSVNPLACLSQTASCAPKVPQFTYNGFDNEYIIL
ncbi:membrane primary amine oxidase-like isoform X2 [Bufo gargarizans]|uniref:membrane primary amine oxidase-like isoform X2 n=1 Tax=Bufo gargarizans TaxID=30331 RepID=UPI001CF29F2A|nr:membrane primary amine oxidase-like isoform X2 [Bufo gargarizans]